MQTATFEDAHVKSESIRVESARASHPANPSRVHYIDFARGCFILLMASSHVLCLAQIPPTSFFASSWWLPRGWATTGFTLLSGFTIATVFPWGGQAAATKRRLLRRARQIFVVMFFSNVVLLTLKFALCNEFHKVIDLSWWMGLLTLQTEYSISGILLPIGILLLVSPWLFELVHKYKLTHFVNGVSLFALFAWGVRYAAASSVSHAGWLDVLFNSGVGGFPIIPMVSYGAVGFALGTVWKRADVGMKLLAFPEVVFASFILVLIAIATPAIQTNILYEPLSGVARFIIILALAAAVTKCSPLNRWLRFVPLIGTYGLFSFLLHRILVQLMIYTSRFGLSASPEHTYLACFGMVILILSLLCWQRRRFGRFDRSFRRLYL